MKKITSIAVSRSFYYYGTDNGEIYYRTPNSSWTLLYTNPTGGRVQSIKTDQKNNHALSFLCIHINDNYEIKSSEAFHLRAENGDVRVEKIDDWIAQLLNPYMYIYGDSLGVYLPTTKQKGIVYSLEWFCDTQNIDIYGMNYLVINREMADSTIYTIDLPSDNPDTFAINGPIFKKFRAMYPESGSITDNMDAFDEQNIKEVQRLNEILPQQLVLTPHHERTYVDFVKVFSNGKRLYVASGGRDGYVCVSDYKTHKLIFKSDYLESTARCAVGYQNNLYFAGDDGMVGSVKLDDLNGATQDVQYLGDESISMIRYSPYHNLLAVRNDDEYVLILDADTFECVQAQQIESEVRDMAFTSDGYLNVITYSDTLVEMAI